VLGLYFYLPSGVKSFYINFKYYPEYEITDDPEYEIAWYALDWKVVEEVLYNGGKFVASGHCSSGECTVTLPDDVSGYSTNEIHYFFIYNPHYTLSNISATGDYTIVTSDSRYSLACALLALSCSCCARSPLSVALYVVPIVLLIVLGCLLVFIKDRICFPPKQKLPCEYQQVNAERLDEDAADRSKTQPQSVIEVHCVPSAPPQA
jgi:hypothetical protein